MHGDFWALLTKNAVLLRRLREEVLKSRSEKPQYGKKCSNAADMDSSESREGAGRAVARLGRDGAAGRNGAAVGRSGGAAGRSGVVAGRNGGATTSQRVAAAGRRGAAATFAPPL